MREKTSRVEDNDQYNYVKDANTAKYRINLNNLLRRMKDERERDKRTNLLILAGSFSVALVVFIIFAL